MSIIGLLVTLLVIGLIIYVVNLVIGMLSLPPVVKTIALIIIGVIALLYILQIFGVAVPLGMPLK